MEQISKIWNYSLYTGRNDKNMSLIKRVILLGFLLLLSACADYKSNKSIQIKEREFYSSKGFALIYTGSLFEKGGVDKEFNTNEVIDNRLNNEQILTMHSTLKKDTHIRIINPVTSKFVDTKILKRANYPKIFNIVMSRKTATILELDIDNPYVEIFEVKKNKTFIAKESNTFEEEKQLPESAPVDDIKEDDLSEKQIDLKKTLDKNNNFILVRSDFY